MTNEKFLGILYGIKTVLLVEMPEKGTRERKLLDFVDNMIDEEYNQE